MMYYHHKKFGPESRVGFKWLEIVGFDFLALSIVQAINEMGILVVCVLAVGYNSFWTWETARKKKVETRFSITDVYQNFDEPLSKIITIFCGQSLLFVVYINALVRKWSVNDTSYGFWVSSVVGVQMVGFFGRGKDSQLGDAFNGKLWTFLLRTRHSLRLIKAGSEEDAFHPSALSTIARALASFLTNAVMRDCIAFTVPFLLMQQDDGIEFVKDALATAFLTNLDMTQAGTTFVVAEEEEKELENNCANFAEAIDGV